MDNIDGRLWESLTTDVCCCHVTIGISSSTHSPSQQIRVQPDLTMKRTNRFSRDGEIRRQSPVRRMNYLQAVFRPRPWGDISENIKMTVFFSKYTQTCIAKSYPHMTPFFIDNFVAKSQFMNSSNRRRKYEQQTNIKHCRRIPKYSKID